MRQPLQLLVLHQVGGWQGRVRRGLGRVTRSACCLRAWRLRTCLQPSRRCWECHQLPAVRCLQCDKQQARRHRHPHLPLQLSMAVRLLRQPLPPQPSSTGSRSQVGRQNLPPPSRCPRMPRVVVLPAHQPHKAHQRPAAQPSQQHPASHSQPAPAAATAFCCNCRGRMRGAWPTETWRRRWRCLATLGSQPSGACWLLLSTQMGSRPWMKRSAGGQS